MAKLAPIYNDAQFINSIAATGAKVFTYAAGSSTKQTTYTDAAGLTPQSNPIILNARGEPASPIWLAEGQSYKFVFTSPTDTDPPTSPIRTIDNITGVNDTAAFTVDQWQPSGSTPSYVSATSFTVPGDQTSDFLPGRRTKSSVTAGTAYGTIASAVFTTLTTVTLVNDAGSALDSGLTAVQLGILTRQNTSIPSLTDAQFRVVGSGDPTKQVALEVDGLTTGITRTITVPDRDITLAGTDDLVAVLGTYKNLQTINNTGTPNSILDITADEIVLKNASGKAYLASAVTLSVNIATTGANGLDTGAEAASTVYYAWVIYNPTTLTVAGLLSLSKTAPTLPSGYTFKAQIGQIYNDASSNFYRQTQLNNYVILDATTVSTLTSVDFLGLPPNIPGYTASFNLVSTSGTSNMIAQIGDSGGVEVTTYTSSAGHVTGSPAASAFTAAFGIHESVVAAETHSGMAVFSMANRDLRTWTCLSVLSDSTARVNIGGGVKQLSAAPLDRIRFTMANGTDTFDAGNISLSYTIPN